MRRAISFATLTVSNYMQIALVRTVHEDVWLQNAQPSLALDSFIQTTLESKGRNQREHQGVIYSVLPF